MHSMTQGAHPRSRGEHRLLRLCSVSEPGSSPLARGTLSFLCRFSLRAGLIPARAGNTGLHLARVQAQGAHPRSRGEHNAMLHHEPVPRGSSPLARGTQHAYTAVQSSEGLIPARAGNTHRGGHSKKSIRAHPRSRGEHFVLSARLLWRMGSSPLARGTLPDLDISAVWVGLIPARAGNTP